MKKDRGVSLAIPTMQVQELNNEFNTPLDLVKVIVERHKPYHSADITVEQRAFQVTEKVTNDDEEEEEEKKGPTLPRLALALCSLLTTDRLCLVALFRLCFRLHHTHTHTPPPPLPSRGRSHRRRPAAHRLTSRSSGKRRR